MRTGLLVAVCLLSLGCRPGEDARVVLRIAASASGAEARALDEQLRRYMAEHPHVRVERMPSPDAADERHQLYVQWLNAGVGDPDVLQLDVVWTAEFAAAKWIAPLPAPPDADDFLPSALSAARYAGTQYAVPWFVDAGMLYFRSDLFPTAPRSYDELARMSAEARRIHGLPYGFVWQAARYEGLVTVFFEVLGGYGGELVDEKGRPAVNSEQGRAALGFLTDAIHGSHISPEALLTWQEEETRFAFQNGQAAFMRNWPYADALLRDERDSRVAGRFGVAPMPSQAGGAPTSALGGQQLAVNARSEHQEEALALVRYLTSSAEMVRRTLLAGLLPARNSSYENRAIDAALPAGASRVREIVLAARPRPGTPVYSEMSEGLQIELHRALTLQTGPAAALASAERRMERALAAASGAPRDRGTRAWFWSAVGVLVAALVTGFVRRRRGRGPQSSALHAADARLGVALALPCVLVVLAVALFPLAWTAFESLHAHDLRRPFEGRTFVGFANYVGAFRSPRFVHAAARTLGFAGVSVLFEIGIGLFIALALHEAFRGRGAARTVVLLPWGLPTVVAALAFRFAFATEGGIVNAVILGTGVVDRPVGWLSNEYAAWVPLIVADVWKTTPFVALLLLAGLQSLDGSVLEAARMDGAGALSRLRHVILPHLRPAIAVAMIFRLLDAVRAFDLFYVLTGGGPGTATEPVSLHAYQTMLKSLRFGYGSAISLLVFAISLLLALVTIRLVDREATGAP